MLRIPLIYVFRLVKNKITDRSVISQQIHEPKSEHICLNIRHLTKLSCVKSKLSIQDIECCFLVFDSLWDFTLWPLFTLHQEVKSLFSLLGADINCYWGKNETRRTPGGEKQTLQPNENSAATRIWIIL